MDGLILLLTLTVWWLGIGLTFWVLGFLFAIVFSVHAGIDMSNVHHMEPAARYARSESHYYAPFWWAILGGVPIWPMSAPWEFWVRRLVFWPTAMVFMAIKFRRMFQLLPDPPPYPFRWTDASAENRQRHLESIIGCHHRPTPAGTPTWEEEPNGCVTRWVLHWRAP